MSRYVVDALAAVKYLLRTPLGLTVADPIEDSSLIAPELDGRGSAVGTASTCHGYEGIGWTTEKRSGHGPPVNLLNAINSTLRP